MQGEEWREGSIRGSSCEALRRGYKKEDSRIHGRRDLVLASPAREKNKKADHRRERGAVPETLRMQRRLTAFSRNSSRISFTYVSPPLRCRRKNRTSVHGVLAKLSCLGVSRANATQCSIHNHRSHSKVRLALNNGSPILSYMGCRIRSLSMQCGGHPRPGEIMPLDDAAGGYTCTTNVGVTTKALGKCDWNRTKVTPLIRKPCKAMEKGGPPRHGESFRGNDD
ncbi:hypothetical protein VNO77_43516 [Canavalia gladiata]|uniref:Uncharacterized protein n=1 Tax=Canavalia gladiata TaxID=3824 RepID=A0AAN9JWH6_CANGL